MGENIGNFINGVRWFFPEDHAHIVEYHRVREEISWTLKKQLPAWQDLSEKERAGIRKHNEEHWAEMRRIGDMIRDSVKC